MRASVVTHARPFVDPAAFAAFAFVEVEKLGHGESLSNLLKTILFVMAGLVPAIHVFLA
jgi:hypothetical protein